MKSIREKRAADGNRDAYGRRQPTERTLRIAAEGERKRAERERAERERAERERLERKMIQTFSRREEKNSE